MDADQIVFAYSDMSYRYVMSRASQVKMCIRDSPLGPSPLALERLQRSFQHIHYYPDGRGYYLKQALAKKWEVKEEQLVISNGSDELLNLLTQAYLNPGEEAVMVYPTFSEYEFAVRKAGGTPKYIPLEGENFNYNLEAVLGQLTEQTRLVFICSPNNPTGTIAVSYTHLCSPSRCLIAN